MNPRSSLVAALEFARPLVEHGASAEDCVGWVRVILESTPTQLLALYGASGMPPPIAHQPRQSASHPPASPPSMPVQKQLRSTPQPAAVHAAHGLHRDAVPARTLRFLSTHDWQTVHQIVAAIGAPSTHVNVALSRFRSRGIAIETRRGPGNALEYRLACEKGTTVVTP